MHLAKRVGSTGQVICFEPVRPIADRLQANLERNSLNQIAHIERLALSNRAGTTEMAIAASGHSNQGMGSLVEWSHGELTERITVSQASLDEYVDTWQP